MIQVLNSKSPIKFLVRCIAYSIHDYVLDFGDYNFIIGPIRPSSLSEPYRLRLENCQLCSVREVLV